MVLKRKDEFRKDAVFIATRCLHRIGVRGVDRVIRKPFLARFYLFSVAAKRQQTSQWFSLCATLRIWRLAVLS